MGSGRPPPPSEKFKFLEIYIEELPKICFRPSLSPIPPPPPTGRKNTGSAHMLSVRDIFLFFEDNHKNVGAILSLLNY